MDFTPHPQPDLVQDSLLQFRASMAGDRPSFHMPAGQDDFDATSTFGNQTQYYSGQDSYMELEHQQLGPESILYQNVQHDGRYRSTNQASTLVGFCAAPANAALAGTPSFTDPPARKRKRKAPTLRDADWAPHEDRIKILYVDEGKTLIEVKQILEEECKGFVAELRQYRSRITKWNYDKNVKSNEMQSIVRKRQKRKLLEPDRNTLVFEVRGKQVATKEIDRWMKRENVPDSALYAPSSDAPTPAEVVCYTISDRGSPAILSDASPTASQLPEMPSPTLSTISIITRTPARICTAQSPEPPCRSPAPSYSAMNYAWNVGSNAIWSEARLRARYRGHEEYTLWCQIGEAEFVDGYDNKAVQELQFRLLDILVDQGRYRTAEEVARRLVGSYKAPWSNEEDHEVDQLEALCYLGNVLTFQGTLKDAERLLQHTRKRFERLLGDQHPDTLWSLQCLGDALLDQGRYIEAETLLRQTLAGYEKFYGAEHGQTMYALQKLASLLNRQGEHEDAEVMLRRVSQENEKELGDMDPITLRSSYTLAACLYKQGEYVEAEAIALKAGRSQEMIFGKEHPDTIRTFELLSWILEAQDRFEEAEELQQRAVRLNEKVLGREHPDTLASVYDLGEFFYQQKRYPEALELFQRAYEGRVKKLGEEHPDTKNSIEGLKLAQREASVQ